MQFFIKLKTFHMEAYRQQNQSSQNERMVRDITCSDFNLFRVAIAIKPA